MADFQKISKFQRFFNGYNILCLLINIRCWPYSDNENKAKIDNIASPDDFGHNADDEGVDTDDQDMSR